MDLQLEGTCMSNEIAFRDSLTKLRSCDSFGFEMPRGIGRLSSRASSHENIDQLNPLLRDLDFH